MAAPLRTVSILYSVALLILLLHLTPTAAEHGTQEPLTPELTHRTKRVAIVGAGSAGASAAFHLRSRTPARMSLNITVYDRSSRIGGRSTTTSVFDDPSQVAEVGASIFVPINKNLVEAVEHFNLSTSSFAASRPRAAGVAKIGIWDGERFEVVFDDMGSWWGLGKLFWRYGLAPLRTRTLVKKTVEKFLELYDAPVFPFASVAEAVSTLDLSSLLSQHADRAMENEGIAERWRREIVQASTRVNYAQNLDAIHGLGGVVCMATEGAVGVVGGNWQIFDAMVRESRAEVKLDTAITDISRKRHGDGRTRTTVLSAPSESCSFAACDTPEEREFDTIILAHPFHSSDIAIHPALSDPPPRQLFVTLHVTLFTSPLRLSPLFFALPSGAAVPETILTTLPVSSSSSSSSSSFSSSSSSAGAGPAGFFSISTLRTVHNPHVDNRREYLYKIFSPTATNTTFLSALLGVPEDLEAITWVHRKQWQSYPYLTPFANDSNALARIRLDDDHSGGDGIWYTGGIEAVISTMETSSLMGMNVARLVVDAWEEEELQASRADGRGSKADRPEKAGSGEL